MNFTFDKESKLYLLLGLYVGALYAANLLGGKLMPIGFGDRGHVVGQQFAEACSGQLRLSRRGRAQR